MTHANPNGPSAATPPRRLRAEHATLGSVLLAIAGGFVQSSRLEGNAAEQARRYDDRMKEVATDIKNEIRAQNQKLGDVELAVAKIDGRLAANDEARKRDAAELGRVAQDLRDQGKALERAGARLDEHDRRLSEGRK
jgi:hypothetical protein